MEVPSTVQSKGACRVSRLVFNIGIPWWELTELPTPQRIVLVRADGLRNRYQGLAAALSWITWRLGKRARNDL